MINWISVEDRLPMSTTKKLLAYCSNKDDWFSGYFSLHGDLMWWSIYEGSAMDANVTHWVYVEPPIGMIKWEGGL